jgi:hypothetical protein
MRVTAAVILGVSLVFAAPAAADLGCANGQPDAIAMGNGEQVIVDYFRAINDRDYNTAWQYLGQPMRSMYGAPTQNQDADGLANFTSIMSRHVACVRVTDIVVARSSDPDISASMGIQWYRVSFDDEYIIPFEAGAGTLPPFYKAVADPHEGAPPPLIIDQATGV